MLRRRALPGATRALAVPSAVLLAAVLLSVPAAASDAEPGAALGTASDGTGVAAGGEGPVAGGHEAPAPEGGGSLDLLVGDLMAAASPSSLRATAVEGEAAEQVEVFAADFGSGKITFGVEPLPGTPFPADPDLSGATLEVVYTLGERDFVVVTDKDGNSRPPPEDGRLECTTDSDGACDFSLFLANASGTATVTSRQLTAPVGFLLPEDSVLTLADDATCEPAGDAFFDTRCEIVHQDPGVYRALGVALADAANGAPLAGGGFALLTPAPAADPRPSTTTGADGRGLFEGLYLPGSYGVDQTGVPAGYVGVEGRQPFPVPAATSVAEARQPVLLPVQNARQPEPEPSPSPSPEPSPTPSPDPSPTPSPDPSPTSSPDPSPEPSPTPSADPSPSPSPDASPSPTSTVSPTAVSSPSPPAQPSPSPSPSVSAQAGPSPSTSVLPRVQDRQVQASRVPSASPLPRTGSDLSLAAGAGAVLLGLGGALLAAEARTRRRGRTG